MPDGAGPRRSGGPRKPELPLSRFPGPPPLSPGASASRPRGPRWESATALVPPVTLVLRTHVQFSLLCLSLGRSPHSPPPSLPLPGCSYQRPPAALALPAGLKQLDLSQLRPLNLPSPVLAPSFPWGLWWRSQPPAVVPGLCFQSQETIERWEETHQRLPKCRESYQPASLPGGSSPVTSAHPACASHRYKLEWG